MAKKFITIVLLVLLITPAFYLPQQAKRANALFGFGDLVIDIKALAERIIDGGAMLLAQRMIDRMVNSTVKWAQTGFDGNPAYATDPKQYFTTLADGVAGDFIKGSELGYLCSPFQANIRLSLTQEYYEPEPFQCTITEIVGNIENFYSDFSQGGWDAWFSMTQTPTNNPYGAYLKAKIEMDSRLASAIGLKKNELESNQGFFSLKKCTLGKNNGAPTTDPQTENDITWNLPDDPSGCIGGLTETVTPGSFIKSGLDKALPSTLEKLVNVEHIDQLVSAFAAGLLERYVFGPKGLFNKSSYAGEEGRAIINPRPSPNDPPGSSTGEDVDGDGVADGIDADNDGELDICYYGGTDSVLGPPCQLSADEIADSQNGGTPGEGPGGKTASCDVPDQVSVVQAERSKYGANMNATQIVEMLRAIAAHLNTQDLPGKPFGILQKEGGANCNGYSCDIICSGEGSTQTQWDVLGNADPTIGTQTPTWSAIGNIVVRRCEGGEGGGGQCVYTGPGSGGGTDTPLPETPGSGTSGAPTVSSASPTTVTAGQTLTISGTNLTATVQFFDKGGNRNTVTGSVNSTNTQVTVPVPSLAAGSATVRVYKDASTFSNSKSLTISGTGGTGGGTTNNPIQVYGQKNLGPGVFPDPVFFNNRVYVAVKQDNGVNLYRATQMDLSDMQVIRNFPIPAADNSFPRLTSSGGVLWLAYRDGANIQLWRSDTDAIENLGPGYGNDPVALGSGFVAWQSTTDYQIVRRSLTGSLQTFVKKGAPTGLNRILSSGGVVTIDQTLYEAAYKVSWGTKPWVAGNLTVAEDATSGDVGRFDNNASTQFKIFVGDSNTPHAAYDGSAYYAITTWGPEGARVAVVLKPGAIIKATGPISN